MSSKPPRMPVGTPGTKARRADGTLLPGQGALNPGGKPKGIERLMRELVESQVEKWDGRTLDGWEAMTMMMYEVAMGRRPQGDGEIVLTMKDRQSAVQFLFDRVHGKAKIQIESDTTLHAGMQSIDIDSLDPAELDALEAHVELIAAKKAGLVVGSVIDLAPDAMGDDPKEE